MKICTRCKIKKSLDQFNFRIKRIGLRQYQCIECTRAFVKSHYQRNREYYLAKARKRNLDKRTELKAYIESYLLKHPCVDCGESDAVVLEFDHRRDKYKEIGSLVRDRCQLSKIKEEVKKCDVRCANCHRRKTAREFGWTKDTRKFYSPDLVKV